MQNKIWTETVIRNHHSIYETQDSFWIVKENSNVMNL